MVTKQHTRSIFSTDARPMTELIHKSVPPRPQTADDPLFKVGTLSYNWSTIAHGKALAENFFKTHALLFRITKFLGLPYQNKNSSGGAFFSFPKYFLNSLCLWGLTSLNRIHTLSDYGPGRESCTDKTFCPRHGVLSGFVFNAVHRGILPLSIQGILITSP